MSFLYIALLGNFYKLEALKFTLLYTAVNDYFTVCNLLTSSVYYSHT